MSSTPPLPIVAGVLVAGVGLSLWSPVDALLWGLVGYFVIKIAQSTIQTLFGDPRH
ncbi:hypothetical protein [Halonotius roseus]|uniref:hypothetical protein n=1 Tax=Halonotius roseus TaxID=2511997 RepID=UPI00163C34C4|nr:hypothetical protein [Halonotius roseus]